MISMGLHTIMNQAELKGGPHKQRAWGNARPGGEWTGKPGKGERPKPKEPSVSKLTRANAEGHCGTSGRICGVLLTKPGQGVGPLRHFRQDLWSAVDEAW